MPRKPKNQMPDKRFRVRLDDGENEDGSRRRLSFYGATLEEAKERRSEYIKLHPAAAAPADRKITFEKWSARWLAGYCPTVEYNTAQNARNGVKRLSNAVVDDKPFGEYVMTSIRPMHIQTLVALFAGRSTGLIKGNWSLLKRIFESAEDNSIIAVSPCNKRVTKPKGTYVGHRYLEEDERAIIANNWAESRCGIWAMVAMYAGLRRGEFVALTWDDIDLEAKTLTVSRASYFEKNNRAKFKETKTEAGERVIPIVAPLYKALQSIENKTGHVCVSAKGERLTYSAYDRGWASLCLVMERAQNGLIPYGKTVWRRDLSLKKEGYKVWSMTPHDLRYTYATILYDAGVDVKTAQYLLGHKDVMTTMKIYTQLSDKKKRGSYDKLMAYFEEEI